jgi:plasmid stability protein
MTTTALDMRRACDYRIYMSKMIQIRNVPDEIHRKLKARAALAGMSLSDFLLAEARRILEKPSPQEMADRLRQRVPVNPVETPAAAVRREREKR